MKSINFMAVVLLGTLTLTGCQTTGGLGSASQTANAKADQMMYRPAHYANKDQSGPSLVVIPGEIKSNNATFMQKFGPNNIADFAEIELSKANFRVLERSDLGPMLNEIKLAVSLGDRSALRRFKRGKFKSTQWFVRFDVIKAEPVAKATNSFDSRYLGALVGQLSGSGTAGYTASSVKTEDSAGVWIVGMRYKVLNANTTEQVTTGYHEAKMEIGAQGTSVLGFSSGQSGGVTLDTMVQRLVQQGVVDLDGMKGPSRSKSKRYAASGLSRSEVRELQTILADLGYNVGTPDGMAGPRTYQALAKFQADQSLNSSGRFDSATVARLRNVSN